jgi:hypothetical protein
MFGSRHEVREAVGWLDRELSRAAERRLVDPNSLQPLIDGCLIVGTFLEKGGVTDGRLELFTTLMSELANIRDGQRSRLLTPPASGSGDKGLTGEQVRFRAWAGCASIALAADGIGATEADKTVAGATDWLTGDDEMSDRVAGPLGASGVQKARLRIEADEAGDKIAVFAKGVAEHAVLVTPETRADWLLAQLAKGGQAYGL